MYRKYFNNGLSFVAVDEGYKVADDNSELVIPENVFNNSAELEATLAAFFPAYTDSVQDTIAIIEAGSQLNVSDMTMNRIAEAVSLGQASWTSPDVVAYVEWRRALRLIITNKGGTLPIKPAYPAGT